MSMNLAELYNLVNDSPISNFTDNFTHLMMVQATLEQNEVLRAQEEWQSDQLDVLRSLNNRLVNLEKATHDVLTQLGRLADAAEEYVRIERDLLLEMDDPSWPAAREQERQERRDVKMQAEAVASGESEYCVAPTRKIWISPGGYML